MRKQYISILSEHPKYGKMFQKLSLSDLHFFMKFIENNDYLDWEKFENAIAKIDKNDSIYSNYLLVTYLLTSLNSLSQGDRK